MYPQQKPTRKRAKELEPNMKTLTATADNTEASDYPSTQSAQLAQPTAEEVQAAKDVLQEEEVRKAKSVIAEEADRVKKLKEAKELLARLDVSKQAYDAVLWHATAAAGVGAIPAPAIDLAAITAIQVKLLSKLSSIYSVPFSKDWGRSTITALVTSFGSGILVTPLAASLIKVIPFVGQAAGSIALPTVALASTYALGRVTAAHLASGGHLFDLNLEKARQSYVEYYKNAPAV